MKKMTLKDYLSNMDFLFGLPLKTAPFLYIVYCIIYLIKALIPVATISIWKSMIDIIQGIYLQTIPAEEIISPLVAYILLNLLKTEIEVFDQWANTKIVSLTRMYLDTNIMKQYSRIDIENFDQPSKRDIFEAVDNSQWTFTEGVLVPIKLISTGIAFFSVATMFIFLNPLPSTLFLLTVIPYRLAFSKYRKKLEDWSIESVPEAREKEYLKSLLTEDKYAKDLRIYNLRGYYKLKYLELWKYIRAERNRIFRDNFLAGSFMSLMHYTGYVLLIVDSVHKSVTGILGIGKFSSYINAAATSSELFQELVGTVSENLKISLPRVKMYRDFMSMETRVNSGQIKCPERFEIRFEHVSFRYPGSDKEVLHDVSFHMAENEKLAVVGINGSGKTTIVKLLLRFYEPSNGRILIGNKDIQKYDLNSLRSRFSACFQDIRKYALTLGENIMFHVNPDENMYHEVKRTLKQVGLLDKVSSWGKELETPLTRQFESDGKELSGGEWQKLSIARSLFRNLSFLILDEPSSALDPESENHMFSLFYQALKNKAGLIITHRLSGVILADKIIVLVEGKIQEQGCHSELMDLNGDYAQLYRYQAEKYHGMGGL